MSMVTALAESPPPWAICFHSRAERCGVATQSKLWASPSTPAEAIRRYRHAGSTRRCASPMPSAILAVGLPVENSHNPRPKPQLL